MPASGSQGNQLGIGEKLLSIHGGPFSNHIITHFDPLSLLVDAYL